MIINSGLIYRNPKPHVVSRHAYFPWVIQNGEGELLASFVLAEAFESANGNTYVSRSTDNGMTWSEPTPVLQNEEITGMSNCARVTAVKDREVVAVIVRSDRTKHPGEGLANPENLGFVPTEVLIAKSYDFGHNWQQPQKVEPPLIGPSFEACSPIVILKNKNWLWPTSTWRDWDGYCPSGMKMVAFTSTDEGKTWPSYMNVMDSSSEQIIHWEGKIIELADGRLLSIAWVYDEKNGKDLTNHYAISIDGKNWSMPVSTGIQGQTAAILQLSDGRIIVVYRRTDVPGLWCDIVVIKRDEWIRQSQFCLWQGATSKEIKPENRVHEFNELKFGAPSLLELADKNVLVTFWCYEQMVSNIRWIKLAM